MSDRWARFWARVFKAPNGCTLGNGLGPSVRRALAIGEGLEFEEGEENSFTEVLGSLVRARGDAVVLEISKEIVEGGISSELASQALLYLGRMTDDATLEARSWLLQNSLRAQSAKVRSAAAVGLASLGDSFAKRPLERAIAVEVVAELRSDMEQALRELLMRK